MANNRINIHDMKRHCYVWIVLITTLIELPCVSLECLGVNITVATYPAGTISVPYGNPLEIYCVAEMHTSDDIEFTRSGKSLESVKMNETTRRLYIKHPEKQLSVYYCRNKKTGKVCLNRVVVDSPPANVTDFNCVSKNLDVLNCSWTSPHIYSRVNYTVAQSILGSLRLPYCYGHRQHFADNNYYCVWDIYSLPRYTQQEHTLHFYLSACNNFGCNNQSFSIDHYSIVKPDPPSNLKVVKNGTHSILLKWTIPINMVDLLPCGVEHIIEYQVTKLDNTTYFHRVDASSLPSKNETYKFQLNNLPYAHMEYEVRIYIKSKKAVKREYWSDFSYIVFYTASERPQRPPDMIAGAFEQRAFADNRVIYVYWKQLEEYENSGENFTYKVIITQGNKTFPVIYPDKNKSLSFIRQVVSYEALDVNVWSVADNRASIYSSYLYVPAQKDIQSLGLSLFTKIEHDNGTYELYWMGNKDVDNYTLIWCNYEISKVCSGRIDFAVLNPNISNYTISLPRQHKYQFAISANKGTKTSGMVWTECDIAKDALEMYKVPVKLTHSVSSKTYVNLKWRLGCTLPDGVITGYNISYCPLSQSCGSRETKYRYISDSKEMQVLIGDLLPTELYQFTLAIDTIYGRSHFVETTVDG